MPEFQPPPEPREVHQIAHPTRRVYVVRCWPCDTEPLADWCDSVLGRDFFFKRRHLSSILERRNNFVWSVVVDDVCSGLVILYDASILHNLYIDPLLRGEGIGTAVLQHFRPRRIRSKTNMLAGDPTEFYLRNGYVVDQPDPNRPHILDMVLPQGSGESACLNGVAKPSSMLAGTPGAAVAVTPGLGQRVNNGHHSAEVDAESDGSAAIPAGRVVSVDSIAPAANGRAVGVVRSSATSSDEAGTVATPTPTASPLLASGDHVVLTLEQYNALATLKKNRDRIAAYRAKRKAEKFSAK